jgi:hypothetical protein
VGYFGKIDLQNRAIVLRKKGRSIRSIENELKVSRSSVSQWVRGVILTKTQINILYRNKSTGGLKGSFIASQNKINKRIVETKEIERIGSLEIGNISKRDRFMLGIALYLGEGSKTSHNVSFTNSDSKVMKFMKEWLVEFCKIEKNSIRCNIFLHDDLDEGKAKKFWGGILDIKTNQFKKSYIVKNNPDRLRKAKHEYGICRITVSRVSILRQILGWIKAVFYV